MADLTEGIKIGRGCCDNNHEWQWISFMFSQWLMCILGTNN